LQKANTQYSPVLEQQKENSLRRIRGRGKLISIQAEEEAAHCDTVHSLFQSKKLKHGSSKAPGENLTQTSFTQKEKPKEIKKLMS
jgi:hypothetical protein